MNVLFSSREHGYHSLVKVAKMAGLAGGIGFHSDHDDCLLTVPDIDNIDALVRDDRARLRDL